MDLSYTKTYNNKKCVSLSVMRGRYKNGTPHSAQKQNTCNIYVYIKTSYTIKVAPQINRKRIDYLVGDTEKTCSSYRRTRNWIPLENHTLRWILNGLKT